MAISQANLTMMKLRTTNEIQISNCWKLLWFQQHTFQLIIYAIVIMVWAQTCVIIEFCLKLFLSAVAVIGVRLKYVKLKYVSRIHSILHSDAILPRARLPITETEGLWRIEVAKLQRDTRHLTSNSSWQTPTWCLIQLHFRTPPSRSLSLCVVSRRAILSAVRIMCTCELNRNYYTLPRSSSLSNHSPTSSLRLFRMYGEWRLESERGSPIRTVRYSSSLVRFQRDLSELLEEGLWFLLVGLKLVLFCYSLAGELSVAPWRCSKTGVVFMCDVCIIWIGCVAEIVRTGNKERKNRDGTDFCTSAFWFISMGCR